MSEEQLLYRRTVSRQHLELLAQYMERYPPLALASARSREGHVQAKRMWEKIARTLNRVDDSVTKSGKSWARYWIDLKFKIRRKYAVVRKCEAEGSRCAVHLSPLEERIVRVLTDEEGNLLPTASVYHQGKERLPRSHGKETRSFKLKSLDDTKINSCDNDTTDLSNDYLVARADIDTEHVSIPDTTDIKPNINIKNDIDPIQIAGEEKKTIEELRRELLEFELMRQKEMYEMEKQFKRERHELEMSILRIRKQLMMKELNKL